MAGVLTPHMTNPHYLHYLVFLNSLISNVPNVSLVLTPQLVSVAFSMHPYSILHPDIIFAILCVAGFRL